MIYHHFHQEFNLARRSFPVGRIAKTLVIGGKQIVFTFANFPRKLFYAYGIEAA